MSIEIREHSPGQDVEDFIKAPKVINGPDPNFVPMLDMMMKDILNPRKNAYFKHAEVVLLTAWKDGMLAGRMSCQVDREHLQRHNDDVGLFGFFNCIDDPEVARALADAGKAWLARRGMKHMRGPFSLSINEESGILVEGFDTPNMPFCPHHQPYEGALLESVGFDKAKDLLAWKYICGKMPPRAQRALEQINSYPEAKIRTIDFNKEIDQLIEIQDDAWRHNWGHVSMTGDEAKQFARDLSLILDPRIALVAEIDGELAGLCIAIPNLNEATRDLGGALWPVGWAKLLWRLYIKKPKTARLAMLGIKEKFRKQKRYGYLAMAMVAELAQRGEGAGYEWGELSWTLEDNAPVNMLIRACGGKKYKTYRVYETSLEGS